MFDALSDMMSSNTDRLSLTNKDEYNINGVSIYLNNMLKSL